MPPAHSLDATGSRPVQALLDLYAASYLTNHAPRTQAQQQRLFRRFSRDLGTLPLEHLTPLVLRAYTAHLSRTLQPGSVRHYLEVLSAVLTVAVEELGWLPTHPMRHVPKPPPAPGRVRCLTPEERQRLLAACQASRNPWLHLLVLLALTTGCRRGELFGLRWEAVDLERGLLRLAATKNGDRRPVPVPMLALEPLRAWGLGQPAAAPGSRPEPALGSTQGQAWVFPSQGQTRDFPGERSWRQALRQAQVEDFHFHDLRHTFASYMAMSGASLLVIAELLGHRSLTMTRRYSHLTLPHLAGLVEVMARQFFEQG